MTIAKLYERVTGRPYWTGRSMRAEYGPLVGEVYAAELAEYTDAELIARGGEIVAALRARDRLVAEASSGRPAELIDA